MKPASAPRYFAALASAPHSLAGVVECGGLEGEQFGGLELGPAFRQRMRDALVLADRPAEHDALLGVLRRALQRRAAEADRFDGKQHALGIEALQQIS